MSSRAPSAKRLPATRYLRSVRPSIRVSWKRNARTRRTSRPTRKFSSRHTQCRNQSNCGVRSSPRFTPPQVTRRGRRGSRRRRRARVLQPLDHVHRRRRRASSARDESHQQSRERGARGPGPGRGRVARDAAQRCLQSLQRLVERRSRRSAGRQRFVSRRRNRPAPNRATSRAAFCFSLHARERI